MGWRCLSRTRRALFCRQRQTGCPWIHQIKGRIVFSRIWIVGIFFSVYCWRTSHTIWIKSRVWFLISFVACWFPLVAWKTISDRSSTWAVSSVFCNTIWCILYYRSFVCSSWWIVRIVGPHLRLCFYRSHATTQVASMRLSGSHRGFTGVWRSFRGGPADIQLWLCQKPYFDVIRRSNAL